MELILSKTGRIGTRTDVIQDDKKFHLVRETDVDCVINTASQIRELNEMGLAGSKEFQHCAFIPRDMYLDLWAKGIVQDERKFAQWLNDSDFRKFRTSDKRV